MSLWLKLGSIGFKLDSYEDKVKINNKIIFISKKLVNSKFEKLQFEVSKIDKIADKQQLKNKEILDTHEQIHKKVDELTSLIDLLEEKVNGIK